MSAAAEFYDREVEKRIRESFRRAVENFLEVGENLVWLRDHRFAVAGEWLKYLNYLGMRKCSANAYMRVFRWYRAGMLDKVVGSLSFSSLTEYVRDSMGTLSRRAGQPSAISATWSEKGRAPPSSPKGNQEGRDGAQGRKSCRR
jgi:hypothetical protein